MFDTFFFDMLRQLDAVTLFTALFWALSGWLLLKITLRIALAVSSLNKACGYKERMWGKRMVPQHRTQLWFDVLPWLRLTFSVGPFAFRTHRLRTQNHSERCCTIKVASD